MALKTQEFLHIFTQIMANAQRLEAAIHSPNLILTDISIEASLTDDDNSTECTLHFLDGDTRYRLEISRE